MTPEEYIAKLEEENKTLKDKLSEITMVADDEKQSIEHILELEEENKELKEWKENLIRVDKKKAEHIDELDEENEKLKEIMRDVLYRITKYNIKNVVYK
jgi:hypothetical protein